LPDTGTQRLSRRCFERARFEIELWCVTTMAQRIHRWIGLGLMLLPATGVLGSGGCSDDVAPPKQLVPCASGCGACETCEQGVCTPLRDGAACGDGRCYDGQCCDGCWSGTSCKSGSEIGVCGKAGALCNACGAGEACVLGACEDPCKFSAVAVGDGFAFALRPDRRVVAWGENADGQLGIGDSIAATNPQWVSASDRWRQLSAGASHACAVVSGNELYCWGSNTAGELGLGDVSSRALPTRLESELAFVAVAAGSHATCAIDAKGRLYCWGRNSSGELGLGSDAPKSVDTPTPVADFENWAKVALAEAFSCAIRSSGELYCWGKNANGRLGLGASAAASNPNVPTQVGSDANWTDVALGANHGCGLRTDGALYCWGDNAHGQLGLGDRTARPAPERVGTNQWLAVATGANHSCGIDATGKLFCWGVAVSGTAANEQLRQSELTLSATAQAIAARGKSTCVLGAAGELACWGEFAIAGAGRTTATNSAGAGNSGAASATRVLAAPARICVAEPKLASSQLGAAGAAGQTSRNTAGTTSSGATAGNAGAAGEVPPKCPAPPDCKLSICNGVTCGENGKICASGVCSCPSGKTSESSCGDGKDDDCDGAVDCADADCATRACGSASYQRCCAGSCVDTTTNAAHCQGCGLSCDSGQSCKRVADADGTRGQCTCTGNKNCPNNPAQICRAGNDDGQDNLCACDKKAAGNSGCASGQVCEDVAKANFCHY
jgi:hypothetical protein